MKDCIENYYRSITTPQTFRRQTHCKEHERSHTREKNYVCGICSKVLFILFRYSSFCTRSVFIIEFPSIESLERTCEDPQWRRPNSWLSLVPDGITFDLTSCFIFIVLNLIFHCQTFSRTFCFTRHVARCQVRARANLIEDGMDPDETFLAVQIPEGMKKRTTAASAGGNKGRPWKNQGNRILREERLGGHDHSKLKACSVYLKRLTYLENAVEKGCRSMVMQQYNKPRLVL